MKTTNVLFEIGLEEMPARFLNDAQKQLEQKTRDWLTELRIPFEKIKTYVTPRRLAVVITEVAEKQHDIEEEAKGPAKKIALDEEGNWSKAAIGFTKGQGKNVEDIYFKELKGIEYAYVNKFIEGKQTKELLPAFKDVILSLTFPKNMRWSNHNLRFVRPIRWMVALNEHEIIPFEITGVPTNNESQGHRFLGEPIEISSPSTYVDQLKQQYVIVDSDERKDLILQGIKALEGRQNWKVVVDQDLLDEVSHLVEFPTVFSGAFSEEFLSVPEEALITSMKEHQRYFPVRTQDGELLPNFVAVRNGDDHHLETVSKGNEKVLKARLSDARFFYEEDQKHSIEENVNKLEKMVFQEKLGTIADKVRRTITITKKLCSLLQLDEQTTKNAVRAAEISKFDLVTNMVNEFTELQGIMGEKYAILFGENQQVAKAINEHYMPRHAGGELPETVAGSVVSIADKLDTIVGCLSVGIIPSGSQDPYALRRQALGILQIINNQAWDVNVDELFATTLEVYQHTDIETSDLKEVAESIKEFFTLRASYILKDQQVDQDVRDAVLASGIGNVAFTIAKAKQLMEKRHDSSFKPTQEALVRVLNIAAKGEDTGIDPQLFENKQEQELFDTFQTVNTTYQKCLNNHLADEALQQLTTLTSPIHEFFEHTMVMTENDNLKTNRLSLLNQIADIIYAFADLTKIQWKQQQ
ncbi:glycine--tRNA ligase subunit beta [Aquibacillus sediminis]|uniref:glycine--tRNA ligase subunit beta n=1 Tax=Aquibacillus sediminis TaxID=2574734 RepID=UPI00110817A4|nr:glycine--tRNA ligase subunit beta [Aquibacillus sediminis]